MSQITVDQALRAAIAHHQSGRLEQAEGLYRQILSVHPRNADALHLLGVVYGQRGMNDQAIELIRQAIAIAPSIADYHCNLGIFLTSRGFIDEAVTALRRTLSLHANHTEAHNRLGNILAQQGRTDEAIASYQRALAINNALPDVHNNLANAFKDKGQMPQAIAQYRVALSIDPQHVLTLSNLGAALREIGQLNDAIASCRHALAIDSAFAPALINEGHAWRDKHQPDMAAQCFERALALRPGWVEAYIGLAKTLADQRQFDQAVAMFQRALAIRPDDPGTLAALGNLWLEQRQFDPAIQCYQKSLVLQPESPQHLANLANAWWLYGDLDQALACARRALELKPDFALAWHTLGNILKDCGQMEEAIASYRKGLALQPDDIAQHDNLLYALLFHPESDRASLFAEAQIWNDRHARAAPPPVHRQADILPDRPLRIGYVSPDFFNHPVGRFILPLFAQHDRRQFEIFAYSDVSRPDDFTARIKSHVNHWRDILGKSHEEVAQLIQSDRIDILVDLTMHMAANRMPVFIRKPAPIQVTYLAYAGGTAVDAIDFRLTDPYLDPDPAEDRFYFEKSIRLPRTYWCYQPVAGIPPVNALPAASSGQITFGCLNNFSKVSTAALETWAAILAQTPHSRLLLFALPGSHRTRVEQLFARHGIEQSRLEWIGFLPVRDYFHTYLRMDIALDPFPYAGGTTTCDALHMGVPVVTLAGRTAVGRAGVSLLSNAGLPELIAQTPAEYIRIAAELAADLPRLRQLRSTLRARMAASPLTDAAAFARDVEAAYLHMWAMSGKA